MVDELAEFYVHEVTVEPFRGSGSYGPVYGPPVKVACWVDESTRLVRAPDGTEQASSTTITAPLTAKDQLTVGARVLLPSGDSTVVITRAVADSGPLDLPDHVEAACE
ncbi:hypothetical protein [Georgenia faecalis]|uniref:hypothetical protein n=1 Tax=Georgenia faecalis TaxID=2483799 RepID=UPI000FD7D7AE|nr:hypothetical protein [Georgenia faecalis]